MIRDIFSAVYNSNVEMEFCRRSVVGTNCFWSERFFFSSFGSVAKWHESWHIKSLCLFIGPIEKKDVAFFFVHSEHSYYNYFHTFSIRKEFFSNSDPL